MKTHKQKPYCLSIAGFDPSGGAGLSADLRVFARLGCVGMAAASALTPQNSRGVRLIEAVSKTVLASQLEAIFEDITPAAVKTGQIPDIATAKEIVRFMRCRSASSRLVVDPLAVPTRGRRLVSEDAAAYVKKHLLPLCTVATPNAAEASWLAGTDVCDLKSAEIAARIIVPAFAPALVISGLIEDSRICDLLYDGNNTYRFCRRLLDVGEVHGTGCHFSSAICAYLALGCNLTDSVEKAGRRMHFWLSRRLIDPSGTMKIIDT